MKSEKIESCRDDRIEFNTLKSDIDPRHKIKGSHSTIIGGREGKNLLNRVAKSVYVKKIIPGVIENKGTSKGSVRIKLTRCDKNGNVRALLIYGGTVQQVYIITTAKNRDDGEVLIEELRSLL